MRRLTRRRPPILRAPGRPRLWVLGVATVLVAAAVLLVGLAGGADAAPAAPGRAVAAQQECTPGENQYNVLIPDGCYGEHPVGAYDITWKPGFNPLRNMLGFLTMLAYSLGNMFISLAQWSIEWAFMFPIEDYTGAATGLSTMYDQRIFGGALGVSLTTLVYTRAVHVRRVQHPAEQVVDGDR